MTLALYVLSLILPPAVPSQSCTDTTAAIRKMQPDPRVLSDEGLIYLAQSVDIASSRYGVNTDLIVVMAYGETRFSEEEPNTMQISQTWYMNDTAPVECRFSRLDPYYSISCGAYVLSQCADLFKGNSFYLCWSGTHIKDKEAYLRRVKDRWNLLLQR